MEFDFACSSLAGSAAAGAGQNRSGRPAGEAIQDLQDLRVAPYPHVVMLTRMWQLRHTLSAYDATYVALAEALDAQLVTCDAKIASASSHHANVEVL